MRKRAFALVVGLWLAGCDHGKPVTDYAGVGGTVASLSPGADPTLVSLVWIEDDQAPDNGYESGGAVKVSEPLPSDFGFAYVAPTRFAADFDHLRTLAPCPNPDPGTTPCREAGKPLIQGRGKLAIGIFLAFVDANGNGRYDQSEVIRGYAPLYVLYTRDLDAQAIKELGELMVLNPQSLLPGYNYAHVRCKDKVGWTKRFDPFEVVQLMDGKEEVTVMSSEMIMQLLKAGELCTNWT